MPNTRSSGSKEMTPVSSSSDGSERSLRPRRQSSIDAVNKICPPKKPRNSRESTPIPEGQICCLRSEGCAGQATTALTKTEGVCGVCFTAVWNRNREPYDEWKEDYKLNSSCKTKVQFYIQEKLLPYWLKCVKCGKWRSKKSEEPLFARDFKTFQCTDCKEPQSEEVEAVLSDDSWPVGLRVPLLLHNPPTLDALVGRFYYDEIGISPVEYYQYKLNCDFQTEDPKNWLVPFYLPIPDDKNVPRDIERECAVNSLRPCNLEFDEVHDFPIFRSEPSTYFGLRNLLIAMFTMHPIEYLTVDMVSNYVICRGHFRIWATTKVLPQVHDYLTYKGLINYGYLKDVPRPLKTYDKVVAVLGAGISGLTAARAIQKHGIKVVVFEGCDMIGGRMKDEISLGTPVSRGAQIIVGLVNNPIALLCHQIGLKIHSTGDFCPLIDATTHRRVQKKIDQQAALHYDDVNTMVLGELARKNARTVDRAFSEKFDEFHKKAVRMSAFGWTQQHERALQFHLGNLEFSCGAELDGVSWKNMDQNEAVTTFAGEHSVIVDGVGPIIKALSEGTEIHTSKKVSKIVHEDDQEDKVIVQFEDGSIFPCDKALVTFSLAVLQKNHETLFQPPFEEGRVKALAGMGAGLIEKVAVRFTEPFWEDISDNQKMDFFGHVPASKDDRGLFNIFYDFSRREPDEKGEQAFVLMSYVCGSSVDLVNEKTDEEIVEMFCGVLHKLFPKKDIVPIGHMVTHWGKDPLVGMSYSYMAINGVGEHYERLSRPINKKIYFAGEHTNRFMPQTMTGAYVSALREGGRIVEDIRIEVTGSPLETPETILLENGVKAEELKV